ncbi:MAG TPA: glycosyltransferase, partial [Terriglobia bacterium]|nr:glycosyltransferase [Terriglobia bacterium]
QAELVSIFAFMECVSFWERVILPGFGLLLSILFPLRKINDPRSSVALASGGYLLMRRSLWAKLGGYEAIRSEMIDDLNTARRVKHAGHRIYAAATKDLVRTRMYSNLRGIWEGLRKNAFAGHRYSVAKLLASGSAYWLCNVLPVASALYFLGRWAVLGVRPGESEVVAMALSLAQCAMAVAIHLPIVRFLAIPPGYALLAPLGAILYTAISLDSMARTLFGRGVSWKERAYRRPEAEFGGEPG